MSTVLSQKQKTPEPPCFSFAKGPLLKPEEFDKFKDPQKKHQV